MKIHVHFNTFNGKSVEQVCQLDGNLEIGQTATIHAHQAPEECEICPNGHCHAPNISLTRVDEETVFVTLESLLLPTKCEIQDLPIHQSKLHESGH